jgi:hypothetical protein
MTCNDQDPMRGPPEDKIWSLQRRAWCPPREAERDSGGWPERVKARHSEAWASKPADLQEYRPGETKAAREELLRTVQEPEEEAGRPQPRGVSSEALRELVLQGVERKGSQGGCRRAQRRVNLLQRADAAVSK